jgi:hypothetical protein
LESIDAAALLELKFMLESSIDLQFQAWMALSFAVIVASYTAREDLIFKVRIVVAIIYAMSAYALFARWMTEIVRINEIDEILLSRDLALLPVWYAPQARIMTYLFGSFLTVGSVFYFSINTVKNADIDA